MAAALVLLAETLTRSDRPTFAVVWASLTLATYCASLLCLAGVAQHGDLGLTRWKIGPWMLVWYGGSFGIATVTWSQPQTGMPAQIAVTSVLHALWLIAVGLSAWTIGYLIGPAKPAHDLLTRGIAVVGKRFAAQVRSPAAPWILYVIGIAARLAVTATSGIFGYVGDPSTLVHSATSYGGVLGALSLCAPLAVAAASLQVFRERLPGARVTLAVLFMTEVAFGAAAGGKESFVIAVLALVVPFSAARRRLPKAVLIAAILVFLGVVIPFNHAYRDAVRQSSATLSPSQAVSAAPTIFKQAVVGHNVVTVLPQSIDYLMQRIRQIDSSAIIVQRTPRQIGFLSPVQLVEEPAAGMVPRAAWPNKPIMLSGYLFGQEYFGLPSSLYTSTADTVVGGLYMYGGWIPVLVGMFLIGCGIRLLDDILDVRLNPHSIFLVLLLFSILVEGQNDWQTILGTIPATSFVWLLSVALTFGARRST